MNSQRRGGTVAMVTAFVTVGSSASPEKHPRRKITDRDGYQPSPCGAWSGPAMAEYPLEALSEFKISTNNVSAEYAAVGNVGLASRSGTNTPDGSLYFIETNNSFDARNKVFFYTTHDRPIYPAVGSGNEWATEPTAALREGNLSQLLPANNPNPVIIF